MLTAFFLPEAVLEFGLMEDKENRKCAFNECLAYHDGKEIHYFYGKHPGNLSKQIQGKDRKEKWSDLWYIFKPEGFDKTLAEMDEKIGGINCYNK